VLTNQQGRARGVVNSGQRDPSLINPRPPKCVWQQRKDKRFENAKQQVLDELGFGDGEDDVIVDDDEEEDDEDEPSRRHRNPFIIDMCEEEEERPRKRGRIDSDSD